MIIKKIKNILKQKIIDQTKLKKIVNMQDQKISKIDKKFREYVCNNENI